MEDLSGIVESARLPIEIPLHPYLRDHCVDGRAVLPAVEAVELLAREARRFMPGTDVTTMVDLRFDKFLFLDPEARTTAAFCDLALHENGDVQAVLATRTKSKKASMTRVKEHTAVRFSRRKPDRPDLMPVLALDLASALEGVCITVETDDIYRELVPFGPAFRNVTRAHLSSGGAIAEINAPADPVDEKGTRQLGSPFPLDAAFHAACVWGQRFTGVVAFPLAVDGRRIFRKTRPGEPYFGHVTPVRAKPGLLVFDLRVYDGNGGLCETAAGVRMRDVSGGKLKPPRWIAGESQKKTVERIAAQCRAISVIELKSVAPFANKVLSAEEKIRFEKMGDRRRKSFLAARLACKRLSRTLSGHDDVTDPTDISTVWADRPHPCCPRTDGGAVCACSVSHDNRFGVAVACDRPVGIDVEKVSGRILKTRRLYMSESEMALVQASLLGEAETAVRIWSIKEAVTKALDMNLADAWRRIRVTTVDVFESRFKIDDDAQHPAFHDVVGQHVFTLVCLP
ncbi:MAG: polyketide synthase dehydratase domain-containing protein [Desulfobacterales bacterium]